MEVSFYEKIFKMVSTEQSTVTNDGNKVLGLIVSYFNRICQIKSRFCYQMDYHKYLPEYRRF